MREIVEVGQGKGEDTAWRKCRERRVKIIILAGLLRGRCAVCLLEGRREMGLGMYRGSGSGGDGGGVSVNVWNGTVVEI